MNKRPLLAIVFSVSLAAHTFASAAFNRQPLVDKPYAELPLGTVKAEGWLREQLSRMATGMTGQLDELYPEVCGPRNAWRGGDGDTWERGPYWIDGLYPLAQILDDPELEAKAMQWIEWTLANQRPNGQIGPYTLKDEERTRKPPQGAQIQKPDDWWPRMVMLKILMQHYSATGDPRVIDCMTEYFKYQLRELPERPLYDPDNASSGSWWASRRGGDNLMAVYWLYNITGEPFLLELGDLIYQQTTPFTDQFLAGVTIPQMRHQGSGEGFDFVLYNHNAYHCVNLAQAMKTPVIRYQADKDPRHLEAVKKAFSDIEKYHGQPHGLYGGDEGMHGRTLTRGSEFCTAVEMMFSLEKMLEITGDTDFADRLEMTAYNLLPTQATDDFMARQYYQQANQISATFGERNFHNDNSDRVVFGLLTGYPCCTTNMHQGWPKFVQHLWMASSDGGLAALVYGPSSVELDIGGQLVTIFEDTNYPMEDEVGFSIVTDESVSFPLHLRIPGWCDQPSIRYNGEPLSFEVNDGIAVIEKTWNNGDRIDLRLPTPLRVRRWHENSASLYWGPLLFALKMNEQWSTRTEPSSYGRPYYEVRTTTTWNVALVEDEVRDPARYFKIEKREPGEQYFWNVDNAPLSIRVQGFTHPCWETYKEDAGPIPYSPQNPWFRWSTWKPGEIVFELIPYGCTTLRISAFPTLSRPRDAGQWRDPSDY